MDKLTMLVIKDTPTALAALRTGKVDFMQGIGWQDAQSLEKSSPEMEQIDIPMMGMSVVFRCDHEPFSDIRVRKALQMSLSLKEIAQGYYKGSIDGTPSGLISPELKGYAYPYVGGSKGGVCIQPGKSQGVASRSRLSQGF